MPWYWTDDLARTLIDAGKVERSRVAQWIVTPVAIRSDDESAETVAGTLLDDDEEGSSIEAALAA